MGEWACVGGASGAGQMARSHGKFRAECDIAGSRRDHDPSVARAWRGSSASPSDREDYHVWVSVRNGQAAMTRAARERKETEEKEDDDKTVDAVGMQPAGHPRLCAFAIPVF